MSVGRGWADKKQKGRPEGRPRTSLAGATLLHLAKVSYAKPPRDGLDLLQRAWRAIWASIKQHLGAGEQPPALAVPLERDAGVQKPQRDGIVGDG
jgi:hypothetical protein